MGHPTLTAEKLWANFERNADGCWLWTGGRSGNGYGAVRYGSAHVAAYELLVGPVPDGLHLDHLCHNRDLTCPGGWTCIHRRCINPAHLEAITQAENNRRIQERRTRCPEGHLYAGENLYVKPNGVRECRTCRRANRRAWYLTHGR